MTAQEALQASPASLARADVDGGLVSIARSPDGYQLSFLPRTTEGVWNLAATISIGSFPSAEEASNNAWRQCSADPGQWEPAASNLVGRERAESIVPDVEGHHLRHHGAEPHEGTSERFAGHPLHRQLAFVPAGLLTCSLLMDLLHRATGKQVWADAAHHTMWAGAFGGVAAGIANAVAYSSGEKQSQPGSGLMPSMNPVMAGLYGLNLLTRCSRGRPGLFSTMVVGLGTTGLLISAWYGVQAARNHERFSSTLPG